MGEPNAAEDSSSYDPHFVGASAAAADGPPHIASFSGTAPGAQLPDSLQIVQGTSVTLNWEIVGQVDSLAIDGADSPPAPTAKSLTVTPKEDGEYLLHASNQYGEDTAKVHVSVHAANEVVSAHAVIEQSMVIIDKDDIYLDPPMRLLEQCDHRWGSKRIAGAAGAADCPWQENGCNATTAAMILRWFAEDCKAGTSAFPLSATPKVDQSWYPLRMADAWWPNRTPPGKVALTDPKKGNVTIDVDNLFESATYALQNNGGGNASNRVPAKKVVTNGKAAMGVIRGLLKSGPVILGLQNPGGHFVVTQGIKDGGLLVLDPGVVIKEAKDGGVKATDKNKATKTLIQDWSSLGGYLDGTSAANRDKVRMPPKTQSLWAGKPDASEYDGRCYHLLTGGCLDALLGGLSFVVSLSVNAKLVGAPAAVVTDNAPPAAANADGDSCALANRGKQDCEQCAALTTLIDGGNVAQEIAKGAKTADSIKLLQGHLIAFGYDLGGGANKGADGDYGGHTSTALGKFLGEVGTPGDSNSLSAAAAELILAKHVAGFTTGGAATASADSAPASAPATSAAAGPASQGKINSSNIKVGGTDFASWFNGSFLNNQKGVKSPDLVKGVHLPAFPNAITPANFQKIFDQIPALTGLKEINLLQFAAAFSIPYNETGGTFVPKMESGGGASLPRAAPTKVIQFGEVGYFFWGIANTKASYNQPADGWRLQAGDQLFKKGLITKDQVAVWNGQPQFNLDKGWEKRDPLSEPQHYPNPQGEPLLSAQKDCDFYKYRGRGLTQTTGAESYKRFCDPALVAAGLKKSGDLTNAELDDAVMHNPTVYSGLFRHEFEWNLRPAKGFAGLTDDAQLTAVGDKFAGGTANYGSFYRWRCNVLIKAMTDAGWSAG